MVTISRTVEKIIEENPFLQEALSRGIINYAALADDFKPRIDRELKQSVKESAIMMALRRLNEKLEKTFARKAKFNKDADIFVQSDLFEITVKKSGKTFQLVKEIYELINPEKDFLTLTQGVHQVTIIANKRNQKFIYKTFERERIIKEIGNLAAISTGLPSTAIDEAGYLYLITRAFAWENISIVEIVSTFTELALILKEKDVPKAFTVMKEVIEKNS